MANKIYELLSLSINAGDYTLTEMQEKVAVLYAAGCLETEEQEKLLNQAIANLDPENERGDVQEQLEYLGSLITALTERVEALENGTSSGQTGSTYPEWEQPIAGLTTNYSEGAIVSHNGTLWISTYAGQNVWEPGATGTENLWIEYVETETKEE